jgi:hypothetical protein
MRRSEKCGKGLYATKNIKVGDVLMIEENENSILRKSEMYVRCYYCLKESHKNLFPCEHCVKTMFCSKECQEKAQEFHKYECEMMDGLYVTTGNHLAVRIIHFALEAFETVDEWKNFVEANEEIENLEIDYNEKCAKNRYRAFLGLESEFRTDLFESKLKEAYCTYRMLLMDQQIKDRILTEEHKKFFFKMVIRHTNDINSYAFDIFEADQLKAEKLAILPTTKTIAVVMSPISGLLNHSCLPNVAAVYIRRQAVFYASLPIKAGEQFAISYQ